MLVSEILIALRVQTQNFHRTPLIPSEADLAELAHEYFKDAVTTTVKFYNFFTNEI
jgi:hypothetical protein